MSKVKKIAITIILIMLCLVSIFKFTQLGDIVQFYYYGYRISNKSKVEDFSKYKDDYQVIADKPIELREVGILTKEACDIIIEDDKLYNSQDFKEIKLTKAEKNSLSNIQRTFIDSDYPLSVIRVYGETYVAFKPEGPFGIVYSSNGTTPNSLGSENEDDKHYKIKKLLSKWYEVEDK